MALLNFEREVNYFCIFLNYNWKGEFVFIQIIFKFVEPKILIENTGERAFLEILEISHFSSPKFEVWLRLYTEVWLWVSVSMSDCEWVQARMWDRVQQYVWVI